MVNDWVNLGHGEHSAMLLASTSSDGYYMKGTGLYIIELKVQSQVKINYFFI